MKTVFLFLKNSLFISDLLRTKYIEYLSSHYRVVIFSSIRPEKEHYFSSPNIEYVDWKIQSPKLFAWFKFLRTNCIREFDQVSSLQFYYGSPAFKNDKRARILRFLSQPFAKWLTTEFFTKLEMFFLGHSPLFEKYCREYQPALIITATPGIQIFDAEPILFGRKLGIPTLATNFSWDNLTSFKCVRMRKPDYLFVWNEIIKESAVKLHKFAPERITVTGAMRFDRYFDPAFKIPSREEFLRSKNLDPTQKTILFATAGRKSKFQAEVIRTILGWRRRGVLPQVNLLIRVHPFDDINHYQEFIGLDNVCLEAAGKARSYRDDRAVIEIDDQDFLNLKATLAHADINVNYKSTISLESALFDKPVINFVDPTLSFQNKHYYDPNSYYYPVVKNGGVRLTSDAGSFRNAILDYLKNPSLDSEGRRKVATMFFAFTDGLSYRRNVEYIEKLLKK